MTAENLLFTFIAEYDGGTYISQIRAADIVAATKIAQTTIPKDISVTLGRTVEIGELDEPVAIKTTFRVWCLSALDADEELVLVNVIQTDQTNVGL